MIVIFHSQDGQNHCDDGFAAAWCFWKEWEREGRSEPEFIPGVYGTEPPLERCTGQHVMLVDFSYKRDAIRRLQTAAKTIVILDHHKTAQDELAEFPEPPRDFDADVYGEIGPGHNFHPTYSIFDMDRSGARLAWDWCFPGEEPPDLLLRIEDGDLWRWQYDDSKPVQAALRSYPKTFELWGELMARSIQDLVAEGAAIRRFIEAKVAELKPTAWRAEIGGIDMPVCNAPWFLASELAGQLAEDDENGRAAVYFDQPNRRVYSLRSQGDTDVSEIAKKLGGGGHKGAAGFQVPRP